MFLIVFLHTLYIIYCIYAVALDLAGSWNLSIAVETKGLNTPFRQIFPTEVWKMQNGKSKPFGIIYENHDPFIEINGDEFKVGNWHVRVIVLDGDLVGIRIWRRDGKLSYYLPPIIGNGYKFVVPKYLLKYIPFLKDQPEIEA